MTQAVDAAAESMIIERLIPRYDAVTRVHRVVPGRPDDVYEAVRSADFLRAWRDSTAVRVLFAMRSAAERAAALVRRAEFVEPPAPATMRLADMSATGEWVLLGENRPAEIAFGTIGRFWSGETSWVTINAAEFEDFDTPGLARIACNFSLRAYGADHTLVTYECRTAATDAASRRGFLRYWRPLTPFIDVVLRAQLRVVHEEASRPRRSKIRSSP